MYLRSECYRALIVACANTQWKKDPKYAAADAALEEEFALASALIEARGNADNMTQEEVAEAMGTTQAVVARLENGKVRPSTRTLERSAKAVAGGKSHESASRRAKS